ncbi:MAG: patatin-like phospholipase family protein [Alphaproteobacteria bacterium]|nr:patatin-like phospholipase family protein [Alphaproteobacteria bacterium]
MLRPLNGPAPLDLLDALPPSELLVHLAPDVRADLHGRLTLVSARAGDVLFEQGQAGDALYRLVSGRLEVVARDPRGVLRHVADVTPGDWVGEMAMLTGDPRRATVRVRRDALLARLDVSDFRALVTSTPSFLEAVARFTVRRLAEPRSKEPDVKVLAVVPASRGVAARVFGEALGEALSAWGSVRVLGLDDATRALGPLDDATPGALERWLDGREARCRFLVLVAGEADDRWSRAVRRNADRTLLTASVSGTPLHVRRPARAQPTELVLLHGTATRVPRGTAPWLDRYRADAHHHVRLGRADDVARVARFMAGEAIGLALAGGAGRGIAHIGVIQALEEQGIPIDVVCGTSMGAIVGAQHAMGSTADEVFVRTKEAWTDRAAFELTVPVRSLLAGRFLRRTGRVLFGGVRIEDLWRRFACVSTSLGRAERVVHRRGRVDEAVRASSSLPGLFPPVRSGDDLLVDGAFVDNLPADLCRELGAGRVIAVNVLPTVDPVFVRARRRSLRGWARRFNPLSPDRDPMLHDMVMRAYFVPTVLATDAVRAAADLFVEPPLASFGFVDRRPQVYDAIHAAGYHEALRVLREARARDEDWLRAT